MNHFLPNESIKERQNHDSFIKYAKQRELITNLDKKLDYHYLQQGRHPYINDLRDAMKKKKTSSNACNSPAGGDYKTT